MENFVQIWITITIDAVFLELPTIVGESCVLDDTNNELSVKNNNWIYKISNKRRRMWRFLSWLHIEGKKKTENWMLFSCCRLKYTTLFFVSMHYFVLVTNHLVMSLTKLEKENFRLLSTRKLCKNLSDESKNRTNIESFLI